MHPLVKRQLKKLGLLDVIAPSSEQWQAFLEKVGATYTEADQGRELLERSLTLSSEEMKRLYEAQRLADATALDDERDKLQVLIHSLGVGVCALDREGAIQVMNHAAERILLSEPDALLGQRIFEAIEILDGEDLKPSVSGECLLELVSHGKPFEHHDAWFRIQRTTVIPVSFVLSPLLHQGTFAGAVLVFQNTTERKRAEEARALRERLLQQRQAELLRLAKSTVIQGGDLPGALKEITTATASLLNVARTSVWFFSENDSLLTSADLFEPATGAHSGGTVLPLASFPRYCAAIKSEQLIAADRAQDDMRTSEFTDFYLKPLGITSLLATPIQWRGKLVGVVCHEHVGPPRGWLAEDLNVAGSMAGLVSQALEAAERSKSEQAVRSSEERVRLVLDTALDAVVGMDAWGRINHWNRQAETIFGWTRQEVLGLPLEEIIIPPALREAHRQGLQRFLMTGHGPALNRRLELTALRRDGTEFPVELSISPLKVGDHYNFSAFIEDISERKQLQQEMFRANQFMDSLIDSMPIMVFVKDAQDLTFVRWNKAAEELTGIARTEMLGKSDFDFFPREQAECLVARDRKVLEGGVLQEVPQEQMTTRHNGVRLLHTKKFPILDREGRPQYLLGISEDITARQQAETKLRENEEKYRSLFESSRDAIMLLFPPQWTFAAGNPAALTLFGADNMAHFTTLGPWDVSPEHQLTGESSSSKARQMIEIAMQEGSHYYEWTHRKVGGGDFPATVLLTRITLQGRTGLQATVRDISEQKRAIEALRTSEARLTLTVQGSQVGIWDWDLATNSVYYSPEWKAQLGYGDHELPNTIQEWKARLHPEDRHRVIRTLQGALDQQQPQYECEFRLEHRDGTYRWILARGSLSTDPATLSHRMVGIHIDVTDRRRAEEELRKAKEAAEAASRAKSEFLANMSHEIRTPMNGVVGMTELLKGTALTKTQRHYLDTIASSGESLLLLINDILDFSKIEAGKLELQQIEFDLRTAVESVVEQLADRAQQKGVELSCFFQATVPTGVQGDPGRLRQILTNLVGNAVKFTNKGEVAVRVSTEPGYESDTTRTAVRISVTDSGIGISGEGMNQLFQSFTQVDGSSTRQFGGSGLGLAISKQLCELMGGRIGVESELGKGSTFWIVLPLILQTTSHPHHPISPTVLKGKRVCVVETHRTNQEILRHYLHSWGMAPIIAGSGAEALTLLESAAKHGEPCNAVVLDLQLPDMNGLVLAKNIHARSEFGPPPIILMTALCQRGDGEASVRAGCSAYLTKPLRYLDLYECLLQVLGTPPTARQAEAPSLITQHSLAEARTQRRSHVLVVEDNPVNQEVAALLLRNLGCRVDLAGNGHEAVEAVLQTPYDLIFMDCQMPGMDGYTATSAIRKMEREQHTPRIPIVALTAHALHGDRERCLAAGMDDYLTKPFTRERLHAVVETWLSGRRGVAAAPSDQSTPPPAEPRPDRGGFVDRGAWSMFTDLDELGQPDSLSHFMEIFLRDTIRKMDDLRQAVSSGDATTVSKIAHSLKSVSAVLGAMRLSGFYRDLEAYGASASIRPMQALLPEIEDEFTAVCSVFREELTRRGGDVPQH